MPHLVAASPAPEPGGKRLREVAPGEVVGGPGGEAVEGHLIVGDEREEHRIGLALARRHLAVIALVDDAAVVERVIAELVPDGQAAMADEALQKAQASAAEIIIFLNITSGS